MKRIYLILFIICLGSTIYGQETDLRKNTISVEMGFWNRGLTGMSYHRNTEVKSNISFTYGLGAGAGATYNYGGWFGTIDYSLFLYSDGYFGFGESNMKFILGGAVKFTSHEISANEFNQQYQQNVNVVRRREGYSVNPFIGMNYIGDKGFSFQIRVAPLFLNEEFENYAVRSGIGFSYGYSF